MQFALRECDICGRKTREEVCKKEKWGILLIDNEDDLKEDPLSPFDKRIDICNNCMEDIIKKIPNQIEEH